MRTRKKKKMTREQQQVNDAILAKAHADLWNELEKERLEAKLMDDLERYFTDALVPVKPPVTYRDLDNRDDGQPLPATRIGDGPIYQSVQSDISYERGTIFGNKTRIIRHNKKFTQHDSLGRPIEREITKKEPGLVDSLISIFKWIVYGK